MPVARSTAIALILSAGMASAYPEPIEVTLASIDSGQDTSGLLVADVPELDPSIFDKARTCILIAQDEQPLEIVRTCAK